LAQRGSGVVTVRIVNGRDREAGAAGPRRAKTGEVAAADVRRRHGNGLQRGLAHSQSLIPQEEEKLVVLDWPAERAAELVLPEWRLVPPGLVIEEVISVQ